MNKLAPVILYYPLQLMHDMERVFILLTIMPAQTAFFQKHFFLPQASSPLSSLSHIIEICKSLSY